MKKTLLSLLATISFFAAFAQGSLHGDIMTNVNFYENDPTIIEANNSLYERYKNGGEGWLGLRYNDKGFSAFLRVDAFQNSNLKYLTSPMTTFGVGAFNLTKEIGDLTISAGYIYDQIGSGIVFRSYEDRGLLIDNALVGLSLKYKLTDNITIKGITGQQKDNSAVNRFYAPIIKAFSVDGDFSIGKVLLSPGIGAMNRTLDQGSMDAIVSTINNQPIGDRFIPMYNTYIFTGYNTLNYENISWYAEAAFKTHEAINNVVGKLEDQSGSTLYSTIGWAKKGIAVNLSAKRTENFVMRTSPSETLLNGMLNWQPVVAIIRPHRLLARYSPASQELSELSYKADVFIAPNDDYNINLNYTHTNKLDGESLYREIFADAEYRGFKKWRLGGGIQYMEYNLQVYRSEPLPYMYSITPFIDVTYRINSKQALRAEIEYQSTKQDRGSWVFAMFEYSIAPRWSFAISDMYNINPEFEANPLTGVLQQKEKIHYPTVFGAYTTGPHRFTLAYVKQVAGINCTGGVCRYEPAFSGVKAQITSNF